MTVITVLDSRKKKSKAVESGQGTYPLSGEKREKKTKGKYEYEHTGLPGIMRVVSHQGGFLVTLDYGKALKPNKKTGQLEWKQQKTTKHVATEKEAKLLRAEAEIIRSKGVNDRVLPRKILFKQVVEEYFQSSDWKELSQQKKDHYKNYFRHMQDFFANMEPKNITRLDIDKYYQFQLERGKRSTAKKNKDGSISKKEGISVNTLHKHKSAMKEFWKYLVDSKKYGVTENVVEASKIPKVKQVVDGKEVTVSKIEYHARPLTLDELNYTLNDAIQNEYDRSIAVMIALAAIGSLRHSEAVGLELRKYLHSECMEVSDEIIEKYTSLDKRYYEENDNLMFIDTAIMKIGGKDIVKLPKNEKVRVSAVPECLKKIVDYALEQRQQFYKITGQKMDKHDNVYLPLINVVRGQSLNSAKLGKKWKQYQVRRNKRMLKAGLEPIPMVRYHDLRHTHSNLLEEHAPICEIARNMGHELPKAMRNTTSLIYWNEVEPKRDNIIHYFDENIKIDWDKALNIPLNAEGSQITINGSGHLIISDEVAKKRKEKGKKFIFKEEELEQLFLGEAVD